MKIGIDGTPLAFSHHCGVKHYSEELIKALSKIDSQNKYIIFSPKKVRIPQKSNFGLILYPTFFPVFKRQIFLGHLAKKEKVDVFHYLEPYGSVFFKHPKIITTVHDVDLSITYPTNLGIKYALKRYYCELTRLAVAKRTKKFIAVSNTISQEFNRYLAKINKTAQIKTIYEAPTAEFCTVGPKQKLKGNFFLCLADFSPRKNIKNVFKAFEMLPKDIKNKYRLKLVVSTPGAARDFVNKHADILVNVSTERLILLYNSATTLIYPSLYEGFGLPILEAMACGCPVITSNLGSTKETAGDGALLVNPSSPRAISAAMQEIVNSPKLRKNLIQKGVKRAKMFSWETAARKTLELYNKVYKK